MSTRAFRCKGASNLARRAAKYWVLFGIVAVSGHYQQQSKLTSPNPSQAVKLYLHLLQAFASIAHSKHPAVPCCVFAQSLCLTCSDRVAQHAMLMPEPALSQESSSASCTAVLAPPAESSVEASWDDANISSRALAVLSPPGEASVSSQHQPSSIREALAARLSNNGLVKGFRGPVPFTAGKLLRHWALH